MKQNIVLIGFMGSGKTTIGKDLAILKNCCFYDSDHELEKKLKTTIPEIFTSKGEAFFREEEVKVIEELSRINGCVIATGGGAILDKRNIEALRANGTLIYLKANYEHVYQNIQGKNDRPLLNTKDPLKTLKKLMKSRENIYEEACDYKVDVSNRSIPEIINNIKELFKYNDIFENETKS